MSEIYSHNSNYFAKPTKNIKRRTKFTYTCEHKVDIIELSNIWMCLDNIYITLGIICES